MQQPLRMCNDPKCAFRNRLLADAKLTTPHVCPQPLAIPLFVDPFPPPKPITVLPTPPLAPAPAVPFYFPPPSLPPPAPAFFQMPGPPVPMMPPAPMPPGPYMLPTPPAPPPAQPIAPQPLPEQKTPPPLPPDTQKSPSIGNVVHEKSVHKFEPKKGPISRANREALSDFEERTRRQEYRDLTESSQQQSSNKVDASKPRSILKHSQPGTSAINQEVHVNVYNGAHNSKAKAKNSTADTSRSTTSVPAREAASIREEAIKRAHNLAKGIAKATAPAAMMRDSPNPPPQAGPHLASKPPSHVSAKAPSHASHTKTARPNPSKPPSTVQTSTHRSNPSKARGHGQNPLALAVAEASGNAQVSPPSIESWRESVIRPVPV